jgi:hypothetical protein
MRAFVLGALRFWIARRAAPRAGIPKEKRAWRALNRGALRFWTAKSAAPP